MSYFMSLSDDVFWSGMVFQDGGGGRLLTPLLSWLVGSACSDKGGHHTMFLLILAWGPP